MKITIKVFAFALIFLSAQLLNQKNSLALTHLSSPQSKKSDFRILETSLKIFRIIQSEKPEIIYKVIEKESLHEKKIIFMTQIQHIQILSQIIHKATGHCGGFIDITTESDFNESIQNKTKRTKLPLLSEKDPLISNAVQSVEALRIEGFDKKYSSEFKTRDARTESGKKAPLWLQSQWKRMAEEAGRTDIKVDLMPAPSGVEQNSVRISIPGSSNSNEIVVLGGHLDSINAYSGSAPGSDDDGSGIAALTEVFRILLKHNIHPQKEIQIFGYAAEELGLLGSRLIAESYSKKNLTLIGALQLDMVAYPGDDHNVTFITDNVSKELTQWTEQIYGMYVGTNIQRERCGYACSDHASWNRYGFRSVMPFESKMDEMNPRIHSAKDIWDNKLDAEYASLFSKLGVAFAIELSK